MWTVHEIIGDLPNYFYSPNTYSIAYYLVPELPSKPYLFLWEIINLLLLYLILFSKYKLKVAYSIGLVVSLTIYFSIYYSFGKIDHNYANILFIPFACLALSAKNKWSINTIYFILLFSFLSSGLVKVLDFSYLSIETHKVFGLIENKSFLTWYDDLLLTNFVSIFLKETLDYGALFLEIGLVVLVLYNHKYISLLIFFACIFHCLNYYLFNIKFGGQRYIYLYITFVLLYYRHKALDRIFRKSLDSLNGRYTYYLLIVIFLIQVWIMKTRQPINIIGSSFGFYAFYIILALINLYLFKKTQSLQLKSIHG